MKRPGTVWFFSILVTIGTIITIILSIIVLTTPSGRMGVSDIQYYSQIFSLILVIPQLIFIIRFFMLKRSSLFWLYLLFGLSLAIDLVAKKWLAAFITAIFGWAIWDYIQHKKVDGKLVFN